MGRCEVSVEKCGETCQVSLWGEVLGECKGCGERCRVSVEGVGRDAGKE